WAPAVEIARPPALPQPAPAPAVEIARPPALPQPTPALPLPTPAAPARPAVPAPVAVLAPEPSVATVSPQALRIQAGGGAVTLTLGGAALDKLQSVAVVQSGRAVAGIVAQLGPAVPTSRIVIITVQSSAAPGKDYQIQLSGGRQPIVVAAPLEVFWPISAAPLVSTPAMPVPALTRVEPTTD